MANPGPSHCKALSRVLAYLHRTRRWVLRLKPRVDDPRLSIYSDASWTVNNSISGGMVLFHGMIIAWWTRRQKSVSSSSAEAEYFAAALASREGVYYRDLAEDAAHGPTGPTPLKLDNKSAIELTHDPVAFKKTKHILRAANELRDRVARDIFRPEFVEGSAQLADLMTKGLGPASHRVQLARVLHQEPDETP